MRVTVPSAGAPAYHVICRCHKFAHLKQSAQFSSNIMGSIVSSIGNGINAIVSAIAGVIMTIVGAITSVIVTIFHVIADILCCRCFGSRRSGG
ncbi:hypothetical protein Hypma_009289 [Hypsizygus marmoreus]|uniref:Uncharacterized protein n=1 Tax=Hypsizygus marmoreus TaxID=39966 RepID=A0A369JP10_HYPMA|nr:hypothetical protein Hypma_009289 [Hypsizygus marmoreus]